MIIKEKFTKPYVCVLLFLGVFVAVAFTLKFHNMSGVLLMICICSFCLLYLLSMGKTLILDDEGITVTCLIYRKRYRWDELQVKRFFYCGTANRYEIPIFGAEFSVKPVHRSKRMMPSAYSLLFRPISYLYVYFQSDHPYMQRRGIDLPYACNEQELKKLLMQWKVFVADDLERLNID